MMNNTINEIKNSPEGINSRITGEKEQISDLEDKIEVENFLIRTYGNFLDMLKVLVTSRPRDLCSNVLRSQVPT